MAALFGLAHRNWQILNPPVEPKKSERPLKFGVLGAADIGPQAITTPAKTHPDVVVQAVAARSQSKANAYAKKYGIKEVKGTYQDILDDPEIDCVYIPLPNGLHYEWALKALRAGKHVLLEKPSVNNTTEAETIFRSPVLSGPTAPVLLEAAHYAFHPAWTQFMSLVAPSAVVSAKAVLWAPRWMFSDDNIRFRYELAGGALMDLGSYTTSALVRIFGSVAEECEECVTEASPTDARCDRAYKAKYRFPGGRHGEMEGHLQAPLLDRLWPNIHVVHRAVAITPKDAGVEVGDGQEVTRKRNIIFTNFVQPAFFHSIQVDDEFTIRKIGDVKSVVKRWNKSETLKAYTFRDAGIDQPGEPYWATYRYQLEQFVNKVRKREVSQWVENEASIDTLRMLDMAYTAAKLPLRPTSEYK